MTGRKKIDSTFFRERSCSDELLSDIIAYERLAHSHIQRESAEPCPVSSLWRIVDRMAGTVSVIFYYEGNVNVIAINLSTAYVNGCNEFKIWENIRLDHVELRCVGVQSPNSGCGKVSAIPKS